jgi:hypothetical protein
MVKTSFCALAANTYIHTYIPSLGGFRAMSFGPSCQKDGPNGTFPDTSFTTMQRFVSYM